jgi:hypothetical protein
MQLNFKMIVDIVCIHPQRHILQPANGVQWMGGILRKMASEGQRRLAVTIEIWQGLGFRDRVEGHLPALWPGPH